MLHDRFGRASDTVQRMEHELVAVGLDDVAAIHDLIRRWESHWEVPLATSVDEVAEDLADPHLHPALDTRAVWAGRRLAAFGTVRHTPSGERLERVFVGGYVDPEMRGNGLGRRLLAWQIERATEKLRECDPSLPWFIRTHEWDWIDDALHLHRRFGFETVRWFEDMIRALDAPLEAQVPDGVEIVDWSESQSEDLRLLANAAFADHWGSTPRDATAWEHLLSGSTMRPDLSFVAVAGERAIGFTLNAHFPADEEVTGRRDGWIMSLGVDRDWRGKGIASALISRSLAAFVDSGFTHAMLGVDTDNPTGAAGLYSRLGFRTLHRTVAEEIEVPALSPWSEATGGRGPHEVG